MPQYYEANFKMTAVSLLQQLNHYL